MKFIFPLWIILALLLSSILWADSTRAACPLDSIDPGETSSATNPIQMVVACPCIAWTAPDGIAVDHYHIYANGIMRASQVFKTYEHCLVEKRVVEEVVVKAAATEQAVSDLPVSGSLFVEWVDRQCLDGNKVVPC